MPAPISIKVLADAAQARREVSQFADSTERSTGRVRSSMKKVALLAGGALVAGVAAAAKVGYEFAQSAIEDEKSASRMAQTFRKAAGATKEQVAATEDWITKQGKALGVADDDLRPALGRLVTATKDVKEAQKLTTLAMDVSAGSGKSLESVSTALMKAQNGQVSSLSRLGINTKNAAGETISMEEATKRMSDTFGGAAKANADTLGGRLDRLKLMASEAGEGIGAKMLPVIEKAAGFILDKAVPAVSEFVSNLSDRFGPIVKTVAGFVMNELIPAIRDLAEKWLAGARGAFENIKASMDRNKGTIEDLKNAFSAVWGFIKSSLLPLLGKFYETVLPGIGTAIGVVIDGIKVWMEIFRTLWNSVLQPIITFILKAFASVMDVWAELLKALGKVPGFGWATKAGEAMEDASGKARNLADNIKKIPPLTKVTVQTTYTYKGLRAPGGSGPTRGGDDDFGDTRPRLRNAERGGFDLGTATGRGMVNGLNAMRGKAGDAADKAGEKIIERLRNRLDKAKGIRDSIKGLSESIGSALTGDLFGGTDDESGTALDKFRATLNGAKATADKVKAAIADLLGKGVSGTFLEKLVASGNTGLLLQLQGADDAKSLADTYESIVKANEASGQLVAEQVIGTRLDTVNQSIRELQQQIAKRDERERNEKREPMRITLTGQDISQISRGREITADIRAYKNAGGQVA